jgi:hypothetical protein
MFVVFVIVPILTLVLALVAPIRTRDSIEQKRWAKTIGWCICAIVTAIIAAFNLLIVVLAAI